MAVARSAGLDGHDRQSASATFGRFPASEGSHRMKSPKHDGIKTTSPAPSLGAHLNKIRTEATDGGANGSHEGSEPEYRLKKQKRIAGRT